MRLSQLEPGQRFQVVGLDATTYQLLKLGPCSALVRETERVHVPGFEANGEHVGDFTRAGRTSRISLATDVERETI